MKTIAEKWFYYIQLTLENSNTQFLKLFDSSNKFFGPLNIAHFFRQKKLDISNISVGWTKLLNPWTISSSFSQIFVFNISPKIRKF